MTTSETLGNITTVIKDCVFATTVVPTLLVLRVADSPKKVVAWRRNVLLLSLVIALFSWWIHCQGPPAPPPPLSMSTFWRPKQMISSTTQTTESMLLPYVPDQHDTDPDSNNSPVLLTWHDFWSKHSSQLIESATALAIQAPLHLFYWWSQWLSAELVGYWRQIKNYCFPANDHCSKQVSQHDSNKEKDASLLILYFAAGVLSSSGRKQAMAKQLANALGSRPDLTTTLYDNVVPTKEPLQR